VSSVKRNAREAAKKILKTVGLLDAARRIDSLLNAPPAYRAHERRFRQLKREHAHVLGARLNGDAGRKGVALVCSPGFPEIQIQLGLIKALQLANFEPVALILSRGREGRLLAQHYKVAGVDKVLPWGEFDWQSNSAAAEAVVGRCSSMWDLLEFEHSGVRVGRLAVSTALRSTYRGSLELDAPRDRQLLVNTVAYAMASAEAAQRILQQFHPDAALFVDTVYSPMGELFDLCLQQKVDVIQWQQGHKSNALLFKRYTRETCHAHPASLSSESWSMAQEMEWTEDHPKQLDRELYSTYASGDWYSVVGTQFHKSIIDGTQLRARLGLDPNKKTAVIFPHILWDATLFWGKCLFGNFEEWFVETVRAACANDQVNWVIKIHPANQRLREDGSFKEPAEVVALRKYIGKLPANIIMIPPESEISTYSLFQITDYCITVYGTVGMEAARLGIPVLTGGTGPYDSKGFTVDSNTREEYLEKVRNIQITPPLSSAQQELAERFAYVTFLMRPWHAKSVTLRYLPDPKKFLYEGRVNITSKEEWYTAQDVRSFAEWVANPNKPEEFLARLPQTCRVAQ
jgi:Capsule polysaccharide biosynthesis protein